MATQLTTDSPIQPSYLAIAAIALVLAYTVYLRALPKPIPGIPYNEESSKRLLGDIPLFVALEKAGKRPREFWVNVSRRHNSAITQYFPGPFAKPFLILSDFRETQDLLVRHAKLLDRGVLNNGMWEGAIPHHFIGMNSSDPRFQPSRHLTKDLMTPSFLYSVSMPASNQKVTNFIKLWQFKAQVANGRPFTAIEDLNFFTSDIIIAAALGIRDDESDIVQIHDRLQQAKPAAPSSKDKNQTYTFPEFEPEGLLHTILKTGEVIGGAATAPSRKIYWFVTNLRPSVRKVKEQRRRILQMHIDRASQRVKQNSDGPATRYHAAVDYMVSREIAAANKAGRRPVLDSDQMHDMLFGYCLGGQDTTHSVLSFLVRQLGLHPDAQDTLRSNLRAAYPAAVDEKRSPLMDEILKTHVPFLDAFIEEVMRVDSPAPVLIKETLDELVILGHRVPRGTQIFCPLWGPSITEPALNVEERLRSETSQKHKGEVPSDWSASGYAPGEFHPERWLRKDENTGNTVFSIKAGPTLSFSLGNRECWGKRLAYLELKLVTTLLVWNFDFLPLPAELVDNEAVDVLNAKPKRCYVRLQSR